MSIINFIYKNEKYQIHEELLEGHTDFFQSVKENDSYDQKLLQNQGLLKNMKDY